MEKGTEVKAYVKKKERRPFLRYNDREHIAKDDVRYVTTLILQDGTELVSYSPSIFNNAKTRHAIYVKLSFFRLPNGKTIIFA